MSETPRHKKVDESWKDRVEQEKQQPPPPPGDRAGAVLPAAGETAPAAAAARPPAGPAIGGAGEEGLPEARFDLFVSGLAMDALIALGEVPNPATRKQSTQLPQARYLIDLLGILEEKTRGNLSADEDRLLKDALYQLRMRYLAKSGG